MLNTKHLCHGFVAAALLALSLPASAQLMKVQCPATTVLHPKGSALPAPNQDTVPGGAIKCQEIAGSDGYATMADGSQIYLFGFGPLSGLDQLNQGKPGTLPAAAFLQTYNQANLPGLLASLSASDPKALQADPNFDSTLPVSANGGAMTPAEMVTLGVLAAQQPAPLMAIDEDDEFFLTLSNVGMIMRPDLFEQHTVHFHGYPNASSYFDGVPDASVAISISGSMTYYYLAPDAGTYFWHCHITPPEHLQMGMVGQLYVRPRQNQVAVGGDVYNALVTSNQMVAQLRDPTLATLTTPTPVSKGLACADILCNGQTPAPAGITAAVARESASVKYAYNDGDGTTAYDVEYPIQMMGFDPTFHFVGMTFNPEDFSGMKDKYYMLSGRGYPDTMTSGAITTQASDGLARPSQVMPTQIRLTSCGEISTTVTTAPATCDGVAHRALLRVSNLSVTEFSTLATIGIPMNVIALDARLLRDTVGNNLYYQTNSITMGGGQTTDVILDSKNVPPGTYFLYSTNLDHLSNDAENFGGMMTEIVVN